MKHPTDWYEKLSKKYTDEELAEGYVFPTELSEEEWDQANEELRKYRIARRKNRTEQQRLLSEVTRLRIQVSDYLKDNIFLESFSFGKILEQYIQILRRSKKDFSADIDIHQTKLSRILNDRENPNVDLMYRLGRHSGRLIPAKIWWKLVARKQEHTIMTNQEEREAAEQHVKNFLNFS